MGQLFQGTKEAIKVEADVSTEHGFNANVRAMILMCRWHREYYAYLNKYFYTCDLEFLRNLADSGLRIRALRSTMTGSVRWSRICTPAACLCRNKNRLDHQRRRELSACLIDIAACLPR
jgi:hypothetical protein